ncbi:GerAB/ArcD/ProY family transporter [Oceanobacillus sp. CFH 90083]|uniref:GerAB/ArcD/ProY family transporter n=1 Tax=Oceanobacillus sp. CFH 90083 TaxID=2592336 RepID=UPI00128C383F|nr:GerAB/ArcD/ProY family transporter [Oceanobacillus sp. CFH 90083]
MKINNLLIILFFFITNVGVMFLLYPTLILDTVDNGHWLVVLLHGFSHIIILGVLLVGLSKLKEPNILRYVPKNRWIISVAIFVPLALFIIGTVIVSIRTYAEFTTVLFLNQTPILYVMIIFIATATYIGLGSMESIFRTTFLIAAASSFFILIIFILSFLNARWYNLFPIKVDRIDFLFEMPFITGFLILTPTFLFLAFLPKGKKMDVKSIFWFAWFIIPLIFIAAYSPMLVFGYEAAQNFTFPYIEMLATVDIQWSIFETLTSLFGLSLLIYATLFLGMLLHILRMLYQSVFQTGSLHASIALVVMVIVITLTANMISTWDEVQNHIAWLIPFRFYSIISLLIFIFWIGRREKHEA